ncbi:MAG: creatininase family protein [Nitrososphaerales archaeon]
MDSNILAEMNAQQIRKKVRKDTIAVLIFGAFENHGDHMPFGSDFITPFEIAKRVARKHAKLIILPPFPYGVSLHHKDFFMTMSLEPETMIGVIRDILLSLIGNGVKRILIINGHDGNIAPIELAARSVKAKNPAVVIACLESWWELVGKVLKKTFKTWQGLGHGGEAETSAMLALRPELVNMKNAPKTIVPKLPEHIRIYWQFNELSDTGAAGAPRQARKEKGEKIVKALEDTLLSFIQKMDKSGWKYGISH